tara:strand:- start:425 stop:1135 length:711 start_codon:yes stop_codon:yes gene_type:complete
MIQIEDVPISILTPTYNRSKFLPLYIDNLKKFNYNKSLLELVIDDDGDEPFISDLENFKKEVHPISVNYLRSNKRKTIGEKRNNLVKKSTNKIVCFMDDDDIYHPEYIAYSLFVLKNSKAGLVGSPQMLFVYPELNFKMTYISCEKKFQIHEATIMMTKKYFKSMGGFEKSSQGEGAKIIGLQDKNVFKTEINLIMICVAHSGNSVDKSMFNEDKHNLNQNLEDKEKLDILKSILL